jgi:hypothetical protein
MREEQVKGLLSPARVKRSSFHLPSLIRAEIRQIRTGNSMLNRCFESADCRCSFLTCSIHRTAQASVSMRAQVLATAQPAEQIQRASRLQLRRLPGA